MKPFNEAIEIFKDQIHNYKNKCMTANNTILSDKEAFFRNLIPFGKRYGGMTGYQRAEKFIKAIDQAIDTGKLTCTEELIDFAIKYPDKGNNLANDIWQAIRQAAGFRKTHLDYLIPRYQDYHRTLVHDKWDDYYEYPDRISSQKATEKLINQAICGDHDAQLFHFTRDHKIKSNFWYRPKSKELADYGQKLLTRLNKHVREIELQEMNSASFKFSP